MLTSRGKRRVAVVARPVDGLLGLLRLCAIPLMIAGGGISALWVVAGLGALSNGVPLALVTVALVLTYAALLQAPMISTHIDPIFDRFRWRLATSCQPDTPSLDGDSYVACMLTPEELRAPLLPYGAQRSAVRELMDACRDGRIGQYWFLEGRSGRGKTRTGLLFIQELVRDQELCKFGAHSFLYDFADSSAEQYAFLKKLGGPRHKQAVVLVDNFQAVRDDVLRRLTIRLINQSPSLSERLLLILTRPPEAWSISPGGEIQLVTQAKAARHHLILPGPPSEALASSLFQLDQVGSQLVRGLEDESVASAPQLQAAQVIARNHSTPPELATLLRLLEGGMVDASALKLVRIIAIVAALSMYSGTFSIRAFQAATQHAIDDGCWALVSQRWQMQSALRRLQRIGLVTRNHRRRTHYSFHEASSKLCIDRLSRIPAFAEVFISVGRSRLHDLESSDNPIISWLIAVEVGAQERAETLFDAAVANGSYTRMLRCLQRARARYRLSGALRLQLAILLDRTGAFEASREEFSDDLMRTLDPASELSVIFAVTRLETSHDKVSAASLDLLCSSSDPAVASVGKYWKLHLAAHRGQFAGPTLRDLATKTLGLIRARDSHWLDYSLGRMHFDSLRHYYLEGATPVDAVASSERTSVGEYLKTRLPSYEAFDTLYTRAHLVVHVLLPQRALLLEPVTVQQAALAQIELHEAETVEGLVKTAQRFYRLARDEFSQCGDREAQYLQADILNSDMIDRGADLATFRLRLRQYEVFVQDTGFDDIASYPHLHYLRWNMLCYYELLSGDGAVAAGHVEEEHLAAAWARLRRIVELDTMVENEYGLMRAKLLELLLNWVEAPPPKTQVSELAAEMEWRGYRREQRLLKHLAERAPLATYQLSDMFRFYPFVGQ